MKWILRCLWQYIQIFGVLVGAAIACSWLLGTDDAVKTWASEHRPITLALVALSMVLFALYRFFEDLDQ